METDNTVPLKNGCITFAQDSMVIRDNARLEKSIVKTGLLTSVVYGISCIFYYNIADDPIMFYSGIFMLLLWLSVTPAMIRRTYQSHILYREIGRIIMRANLDGGIRAKIKLRKGKIRIIQFNRSKKEIRLFIKKLNEFHIDTDHQPALAA